MQMAVVWPVARGSDHEGYRYADRRYGLALRWHGTANSGVVCKPTHWGGLVVKALHSDFRGNTPGHDILWCWQV
eukprot:3468526-Prorocentrum_lima.AAC.1